MRTQTIEGSDRPRPLRVVTTPAPADAVGLEPEGRALKDSSDNGPVIVGVDGSARSIDALVLAEVFAATLRTRLVIAYVHSLGKLSSIFSEDEHELIVRGIAESTFEQIREYLPSVPERRLQLVAETSPAAGLDALAEREHAALLVVGSSHRSTIGRILAGGTAERLLSGASVPVAVAPAGYSDAKRRVQLVGCGFDGSPESHQALAWAAQFARTASARLCILSVHEHTMHATIALNGGLATASLNDILRQQLQEQLVEAASALDPSIEVSQTLLDGDARDHLGSASRELDLLIVGSRGYGPLRAVLLGSVSGALVRSAESPLVVVPRGIKAVQFGAQGSTSPRRIA
jgi:nucleotide-binding universal stress UspA family protein